MKKGIYIKSGKNSNLYVDNDVLRKYYSKDLVFNGVINCDNDTYVFPTFVDEKERVIEMPFVRGGIPFVTKDIITNEDRFLANPKLDDLLCAIDKLYQDTERLSKNKIFISGMDYYDILFCDKRCKVIDTCSYFKSMYSFDEVFSNNIFYVNSCLDYILSLNNELGSNCNNKKYKDYLKLLSDFLKMESGATLKDFRNSVRIRGLK